MENADNYLIVTYPNVQFILDCNPESFIPDILNNELVYRIQIGKEACYVHHLALYI